MAKKHAANSYSNCLAIHKMHLSVRLGYGAAERKKPQPVHVDIKLFYPELRSASLKDDDNFSCYDELSQSIKALCKDREFRLIEYLGHEIYKQIRKGLDKKIKILVKVTKLQLPIDFVDSASFSYTDLPPFSWVVPEI